MSNHTRCPYDFSSAKFKTRDIKRRVSRSGSGLTQTSCQMQIFAESCPAKAAMSGVAGFALGGMFGIFMSSVRPGPALRILSRPPQ